MAILGNNTCSSNISSSYTKGLIIFFAIVSWGVACSDLPQDTQESKDSVLETENPAYSQAKGQDPLFAIVADPTLSSEQERLLRVIENRPTTAEVYFGMLSDASATMLQKNQGVKIDTAPDKQFIAVGEEVRQLTPETTYWRGVLPKQNGSMDLVWSHRDVVGSLDADGTTFEFEPLGEGLHVIIRIDPDGYPKNEDPLRFPERVGEIESEDDDTLSLNDVIPMSHTTNRIDLLVVYTSGAANAAGNINNLIQLAAQRTNVSFTNSNIGGEVHVTHTAQVTYNESNFTYEQHVENMQDDNDGHMDNIHSLRNQHLADVVMLIVDDDSADDWCGWAYEVNASVSTAFAAVNYLCAAPNGLWTLAHELGHLMGARHDRTCDPLNNPYQYGHGYIEPGETWRTMMAINNDQCNDCDGCTRLQYWSNPNVDHPNSGDPMGTTAFENNRRVLNGNMAKFRDFRKIPSPTLLSVTNAWAYGQSPDVNWNGVSGNNVTYSLERCMSQNFCQDPDFQLVTFVNHPVTSFDDIEIEIKDPSQNCPFNMQYRIRAHNVTGLSSPPRYSNTFCGDN